jgi:hypothetical protein
MIIFILRKIPFVIGGIATLFDVIVSTAMSSLVPAAIGGVFTAGGSTYLGIAAGTFAILLACLTGLLWMGLVFFSKANIILRILSLPGAFLTGIVMAFIPFFGTPSHLLFEYLTKNRATANMLCVVPSILMLGLLYLLSGLFCPLISTIMSFLT